MKNLKRMRTYAFLGLVGLAVALVPVFVAAETPSVVKVGLATGLSEIQLALTTADRMNDLSGAQPQTLKVPENTSLVFGIAGETITINGTASGKGPIQLLAGNTFLTWNGRNFRNELLIVRVNGQLNLVNRLPLEEYLRGVVPKEMPAAWPLTALKAQAIAARTYTLATMGRHIAEGFDLCASTHCHVYGGASGEMPSTDQAVAETAGQVIVHKGKIIKAIYHSASGGYTEDPATVWGYSEEYLKPVSDWDHSSPHLSWTRSFEWLDFQGIVAKNHPQVGRVRQVLPVQLGEKGRILKVLIKGDQGEVALEAEQFRFLIGIPSSNAQMALVYGPEPLVTLWWLNKNCLPDVSVSSNEVAGVPVEGISPPWDLPDPWSWLQDKTPLRLVVRGSGWGHRIGFSQWGARGMAEAGYNEKQILTYYYNGVSIVQAGDLK